MKKLQFLGFRFFGKMIASLVVLQLFTVGSTSGQEMQNEQKGADLNFCVDADFVSQTNSCGGQSNGSVTFRAKAEFVSNGCCPVITSIQCILRIGNDEIDVITIAIADISDPITFSGLMPATYNLLITGFNGATSCDNTTKSNFVTITGGNITLSDAGNVVNEICAGSNNGSFQISASSGDAPYFFEISNSAQTFSNIGEGQPVTFTMLGAGTYTVTVTDVNECTGTKTVGIGLQNPEGISVQQDITQVSCFNGNNGAATLTAVGGGGTTFTYSWSNGVNGQTASNLTAGNYQITITATNTGCSKVEAITINQPPELKVTLTKTDISCNGLSDGAISATTSGGTGARTLKWNNNSTENSLSDLPAGTYSATVTDANNCTATASATISEPGALDFIIDPSQNPVQSGQLLEIFLSGTDDVEFFKWDITDLVNLDPTSMSGEVNNNSNIVKILTIEGERSLGGATFQIIPFFNTNCSGDTQTISITVLPNLEADATPFIPEIYTPNGDGQNDLWQVAMPDGVEMGEYTIFNRLGGKVYAGDTLTPWDGSGCPDGPYFYVLRYEQDGEEKVVKGAVTILRTTE